MIKGFTSPDAARRARLLQSYNHLLKHFGPRHWWPAKHAWEMMVGAILTQNTNWGNVEKALAQLRAAKALSVRRIAALPRPRLEALIRPSGFFRQKAQRLQRFARLMKKKPLMYRQLTGRLRVIPKHYARPCWR
jgi:endonuclease-3 related protein